MNYYLFVRRRTCGLWDVVLRTDVTLKRLFSIVEHYTARAGKKYTVTLGGPRQAHRPQAHSAGNRDKDGGNFGAHGNQEQYAPQNGAWAPPASPTCMHKGPDLSEHIIVVPKRCVHMCQEQTTVLMKSFNIKRFHLDITSRLDKRFKRTTTLLNSARKTQERSMVTTKKNGCSPLI